MSTNTKVVLTSEQKSALTEDATNRAVRTAYQQLGIDVLVAVAMFVATTFAVKDGWDEFNWKVLGFSLAKTVIATVAAFVMRRYMDASGIPTPLPPTPVPAPATPAEDEAPTAPGGFVTDPSDLDWPDNPTAVVGTMEDGVDIPGGEPLEGQEPVGPPTDLEQPTDPEHERGGL